MIEERKDITLNEMVERLDTERSMRIGRSALSEALHDELAPLGIQVTVIEPCYIRTDFLDASSLSVSLTMFADYAATAGKVLTVAPGLSHNQPGDPSKLAEVLAAFADAPNPPVRLPLSTGCRQASRAHRASVSGASNRMLSAMLREKRAIRASKAGGEVTSASMPPAVSVLAISHRLFYGFGKKKKKKEFRRNTLSAEPSGTGSDAASTR
jgi:hypothetical protein